MKYFITQEISNILGLKIRTIQKLIRDKKIIAFKLGNRFRVAETDLKTLIDNQRFQYGKARTHFDL